MPEREAAKGELRARAAQKEGFARDFLRRGCSTGLRDRSAASEARSRVPPKVLRTGMRPVVCFV